MKKTLTLSLAVLAGLAATSANAAILHNGWYYAIDANNDGSGGSVYEAHGLAYQISGDKMRFAFSTNMRLTGVTNNNALNDNVGHGDLFLNFTNHNMDSLADFQDTGVYAIRFASTNDSLGNVNGSNTTLGVFDQITPVKLSTNNNGWSSYQAYVNGGFGRNVGAMGDLNSSNADVIPYLGNDKMYTNISAGRLLGGLLSLTRSDLTGMGIDFAHFNADPTDARVFGFEINRALLPIGDFKAHYLEECTNDGMAIFGSNPVPEPASFAAIGIGAAGLLRRRRKTA